MPQDLVKQHWPDETKLVLSFIETVMQTVNMPQAESSLSRLVEAIESGQEREIIIARNGRPAARLVPVVHAPLTQRIGIARGHFECGESDAGDATVAALFAGSDPS